MMRITPGKLSGTLLIEPRVHQDGRGFFLETYHEKKYGEAGLSIRFVQDNHSRSVKNALRGLHTQIEHPQGKLIRVTEGKIFDVAVDLRLSSPTFGQWDAVTLKAEEFKQFYVPPGFAHGFCVLSDSAEVQYKCTDFYDAEDEVTLLWNDPAVGIQWPIQTPLLSERDKRGKPLAQIRPCLG